MTKKHLSILNLLGIFALLLPAQAAPFDSARVVRLVDGKEVFIDRQPARVNSTAAKGQQVSTGTSRAELLFDRRAIGFLGQNSLITLGQDCFRLQSGSVLINGSQQSCLGSKVLGVRGTTYVLSKQSNGNYSLSVLHGEATVEPQTTATKSADIDILSLYPKLNPILSIGSSAWATNTNGLSLGEAAGLILGDLGIYVPIIQHNSREVLYSYTTGSSNFDGFWGGSTEVGYSWFNPNDQSNSTLLLGYDGWEQPTCTHSQLALGAQWQKERWQLGANGGIPLDNCESQLGFAMAQLGVPVANVGEQSVHLSLAPYILSGLGDNYGGGRVSLNVPLSNSINLMGYGQYDDLLDTVVGGQLRISFGVNGDLIDDPNLQTPQQRSPLPMAKQSINQSQPVQISLGSQFKYSDNQRSNPSNSGPQQFSRSERFLIQAGEIASIGTDGNVNSVRKMSRQEFQTIVLENFKGQNPIPEGNSISTTFQHLYGAPSPSVMSATGSDWLIAARTPFPRLRGANNLEIPQDRLPKEKKPPQTVYTKTRYEYICAYDGSNGNLPAGYGIYFGGTSMGTGDTSKALRIEVDDVSHIKCTSSYESGGSIYNYSNPIILKETVI